MPYKCDKCGATNPDEIRPVCSQCRRLWEDSRRPHFYHYTNAEGVKGILQNRSLWATHAAFLNDKSELLYAKDVALRVVKEVASNYPESRSVVEFLERYLGGAAWGTLDFANIYVACFCEDGNLLSQWRGYAAGAAGYTLGFRRSWLTDVVQILRMDPVLGVALVKVEYDVPSQERAFQEIISPLLGQLATVELSEGADKVIAERVPLALRDFGEQAANLALRFKHPSFEEEQEWRIVAVLLGSDHHDLHRVRVSGGLFVPYLELPLNMRAGGNNGLPINRIGVGPSRDPELAERALEELLRSHRLSAWGIYSCGIPLRV